MTKSSKIKTRVGAVAIIKNKQGEILLCKTPINRGVYPGQWSIPGGGIEAGETMGEALVREVREEVGLEIGEIQPFWFQDDKKEKFFYDGHKEKLYMIHLIFESTLKSGTVKINDEFEDYVWVKPEGLKNYDLNEATVKTFLKKGWL